MGYTHGSHWDDETIAKEIYNVMNNLGINRMPSTEEIKSVMHNSALSNAIRRRGGTFELAKKLNLEIKESETSMAKQYERELMRELQIQGWKVEGMSVKHPYDVMVNDCIKIDVKSSKRYYYSKTAYYYTFNLEKRYPTCDLYICYCINDSDEIDKLLIIPSKFLLETQLSVGANSRYDKFNRRWDYLKQYDDFYKSLIEP